MRGAPPGNRERTEAIGREYEPDEKPDTGHEGGEAQDAEAGEERSDPRPGRRPPDQEASEAEHAGGVPERSEDCDGPEERAAQRDPHDGRHDEDPEDRAQDPDDEPPEEGHPDAFAGDHGGVGGAREQRDEQEPQDRDRKGDRDPQQRQEHDEEAGEGALEVELLHMALDRPAGRGRRGARGHVALHVGARPHGRLPVDDGHVAVDAARDDGVTVEHERVAGHTTGDGEVAPADVDGAVHSPVDAGVPVGRHGRPVDGLAVGDDEPTCDVDPPAVIVAYAGVFSTAAGLRGRGERGKHDESARDGSRSKESAEAHDVPYLDDRVEQVNRTPRTNDIG